MLAIKRLKAMQMRIKHSFNALIIRKILMHIKVKGLSCCTTTKTKAIKLDLINPAF